MNIRQLANISFFLFSTAILISITAEFYSIYGLSKLFSGARWSVVIMASALGIAKLVIATLLKTKWDDLSKSLKGYLTGALIVLSLITSLGIYGFLSDAYQQTKSKDDYVQTKIALINKKKEIFEENLKIAKTELLSVNNSIELLRKNISTDNQTQQVIKGQLVTNIISSNKKSVETQLNKTLEDKDRLDTRIISLNDSIQTFNLKIIETEQSSSTTSELGPLRYISKIAGLEMDRVVNYFLLLLVLVFDPLALSLLWAYFSLKINEDKPTKTEDPKEEVTPAPVEPLVESPKPKKRVRNVTKPLGRPRKRKEVNQLIDDVINTPEVPKVVPEPEVKKK